MLGTIILREMQEYIKSKLFLIGFLSIIILVVVSTYVNIEDFTRRDREYLDAGRELRFTGYEVRLGKTPQVLGILVQGKERKLGVIASVTTRKVPTVTTGYLGGKRDRRVEYGSRYSAVDFAFLVRVFMSLMVIFLAFGAVAGEKEKGTLRLVLSNAVPRHILLMGKALGGMAMISLSLFIALLLSLLMIEIHPAVSVHSIDIVRIAAIYGVSLLYLAVFLAAGICVSVAVNRRSAALLVLVQLWFLMVIIYPNIGVILTRKLVPIPTREQWMESRKEAARPFEAARMKAMEALESGVPAEKQLDKWQRYLKIEQVQIESRYAVDRAYVNRQRAQAERAGMITILSPAVAYDAAVQRIARTGMDEHERFLDAVFRYWNRYLPTEKELEFLKMAREGTLLGYLPEFRYPAAPISVDMQAILPAVLLLALTGGAAWSLAYVMFLRKDVR